MDSKEQPTLLHSVSPEPSVLPREMSTAHSPLLVVPSQNPFRAPVRQSSNQTALQQPPSIRTVQLEHVVEAIAGVLFTLTFISMIALFLGSCVHVWNGHHLFALFYVALSLYELLIVALSLYYCCLFEFADITHIIHLNKFYLQSALCAVYHFIVFVLMCVHHLADAASHNRYWYIPAAVAALLGTMSIPLPAICIQLYHEYKYNDHFRARSDSARLARVSEQFSSFQSASTSFDAIESRQQHAMAKAASVSVRAKNIIFRDNVLKGCICVNYVVHLTSFVANPLLTAYIDTPYKQELVDELYPNAARNPLFYLNHLCLRSFVGMTLVSVLFVFGSELTDKTFVHISYATLGDVWKGQVVCTDANSKDSALDIIHSTTANAPSLATERSACCWKSVRDVVVCLCVPSLLLEVRQFAHWIFLLTPASTSDAW